MCSGKPACRNNVRSSKPICRNNVCQSKPTNVNIVPFKPVLTDHIYHVDSSILRQQLLRFSLNKYITFQSCRTMLLLTTSEVSFFINSICVFSILTIIVLNFSISNVQTNCFRSISQISGKVFNSFTLIFLILVIWQFKSFCILVFLSVILLWL